MMEEHEKEFIKLKFGLALKTIIDKNKIKAAENKAKKVKDRNIINSTRKLETASGIRHATIVEILAGKKNAASTTIAALLDALNIGLAEFGFYYDKITEEEIAEYKKEIEKKRKVRIDKIVQNKNSAKNSITKNRK